MSAVTVAVRCRPLSSKEIKENCPVIITMDGDVTTIVDPHGKTKPLSFTFDHSMWSGDVSSPNYISQQVMFEKIGTSLLDNTFQGYNGCLFAYGQTGSGKTYSMLGYGEDKGIIPQLCSDLFARAEKKRETSDGKWECLAEVSYLEIYNEKCRCLLNPNARQIEYKVREHPTTGPYVENLTKMIVHSFEEIEHIMEEGNKTRTVAATAMNATSSRSHAIVTIVFNQVTTHESLANAKSEMCSRLNLVDLAGSERADKTGATGKTLKEGSNINQSLTTLGKVINGLAEGIGKDGQFKKHVPFRDSALTWLLKENLCGNSKTIMLAALSPASSNYEETVSTLRYANQAKSLRTQAVVNEDPSSKKIRELTEEIDRLKALLESGAHASPPKAVETPPLSPGGGGGGAGSMDAYDHLPLAEKMALAQKLLREESMSWEDREINTSFVRDLRSKFTRRQDKNRDLPRLYNLNEDPSMSGCLVHVLSEGDTRVGSAVDEDSHDILMEGEGIEASHAKFNVVPQQTESAPSSGDAAAADALARFETFLTASGAVRLNGRLLAIGEATLLRHNDRLILGEYNVYLFSDSKGGRAASKSPQPEDPSSPTHTRSGPIDFHHALQEKFEAEKLVFLQQQEEMQKKLDDEHKKLELMELARTKQIEQEALAKAAEDAARDKAERDAKALETEKKMMDMEAKLKALEAQQKNSLSVYLAPTSVAQAHSLVNAPSAQTRGPAGGSHLAKHLDASAHKMQSSLIQAAAISGSKVIRLPNQQIFRQKVVLLGHQEVGKTSLRKCFESDPVFFKKLPDVKATTGIETQMKSMKSNEETIDLCISDFAGQESYHSHTLFITSRSVFVLVWKISSIEQDFHSVGISEHELRRLTKWISEVYGKNPEASIVLAATHLDELRDQSQKGVEFILNKVERAISKYIDEIARIDPSTGLKILPPLVANVAVTCKNRTFIAAGKHRALSGNKISSLLQVIADAAYQQCFNDQVFRCGAVPGRHIRLMQEILEMKAHQPHKLLLSLAEYVHMSVRFGVENDAELLQITQLMHSWNCIYMFNQHKLHENLFIFLHPAWLCRLAGTLFSFAHVLRTPMAHRSMIGGLEYQISAAEAVDMQMMAKGFLRLPLARVLFRQPLQSFLKREPEDSDYNLSLQLLQSLSLIQSVSIPCDDANILIEETIAGSPTKHGGGGGFAQSAFDSITRYFVPSLSPFIIPEELRRLAPVIFQRGVHIKFQFNMLPDEMWWRLQCRMQDHQHVVTVPTPRHAKNDDDDDDDDEYRLPESDEDHNRWKDAMWLQNSHSRVLFMRDGPKTIRLFSAEMLNRHADIFADAQPPQASKGAALLLETIEQNISDLLDEYKGIDRQVLVQCPVATCNGWHDVRSILGNDDEIRCATCQQMYNESCIVASGVGSFGPTSFPQADQKDATDLLQWALEDRVYEAVATFLGIQFAPKVRGADEAGDEADFADFDYLVALDKIVRALLLRGVWRKNSVVVVQEDDI